MVDDNSNVFDALADDQRRGLLLDLLDDDPQRVSELAGVSLDLATANDVLLHRYLSTSLDVVGADKPLVRMHTVHLPKLVEGEFVEWDRDGHVVSKGARFDDLKPPLALVDDHRDDATTEESVVPIRR